MLNYYYKILLKKLSILIMNQTLFHVNYDESISCSTMASDIDNESIETSYFTTFEDEEEEEEYDPTKLSPQQLKTGQEIVQAIISGNNRWLILLAQMQSGKTETYLFVCCEIIRLAIAKQVVIFGSGLPCCLNISL
jgi:hypothetical protein